MSYFKMQPDEVVYLCDLKLESLKERLTKLKEELEYDWSKQEKKENEKSWLLKFFPPHPSHYIFDVRINHRDNLESNINAILKIRHAAEAAFEYRTSIYITVEDYDLIRETE